MNDIGNRIYELRLKNNLSQEALADALGVSRQAISKWENSMSVPELEKIVQMSEIFGVSLDYLVKGDFQGVTEEPASDDVTAEKHEESSGYTPKKIQQMIGIMFLGSAIIGLLLGAVYSARTLFQLSLLIMMFGFMLIYIKRNAWLWCLGAITVVTLILGQYMIHPLLYFILLSIEIISFATILIVRMK